MFGAPRIAFLGVCHATSLPQEPSTLVGLSSTVPSFIYPVPLDGLSVVFAIFNPGSCPQAVVRLMRPNGVDEVFNVRIDASASRQLGWQTVVGRLRDGATVDVPGSYPLVLRDGEVEMVIGTILFEQLVAPPLTQDEIDTIRRNPRSMTGVQLQIGCKQCKDSFKVYAALERDPQLEAEGALWNKALPASRTCKCGKSVFDLASIRDNLHGFLRHPPAALPAGMFDTTSLHRLAALKRTCTDFWDLLDRDPPEEEVHAFLRANEVLLQPFSPRRVLSKAPILTRFHCDFALLTASKELVLVEIERPSTQLLKKDGGMSAELQTPFDQIRSWMGVLLDDRNVVIREMGVDPDEVGAIRWVVIAGRDRGNDPEHLRNLKRTLPRDIQFLTFDDLLFAAISLTVTLEGVEGWKSTGVAPPMSTDRR